jgi:hypothetical protein
VFYTYAHYTPEGRLFYIGKGTGYRAYSKYRKNQHWKNIVAKYGQPKVEILANWSSEEEALNHEVLLIECFRDMGYKLCNKTNGGEGTSGYKYTPEQIETSRLAHRGYPAWNKGIPLSAETKQKLSQALIGKVAWNKNKKWDENRKVTQKHSEAARKQFLGNTFRVGNTQNREFVWVGTHTQTGAVIRIVGLKEMFEGGFKSSNICKCVNGKRKTHKGYTWAKEKWEDKKCL